jgi:hypothetical protein
MKLKLISVGIIALLVLTVVPMAVAAQPVPAQPAPTPVSRTVLVEPVYLWSYAPTLTRGPTAGVIPLMRGPIAGIITFNTVSGAYACIGILHLAPNTEYWLGVYAHDSHKTIWVRWTHVKTNVLGQFFAGGKLDTEQLSVTNEAIQMGGVFGVFATPPPP